MNKILGASLSFFVSISSFASVHQIDVALHDGRRITVERSIQETSEFRIAHPFFGLPTTPRFERGGDITKLKFKSPDTQETITWVGEPSYTPVLLDFVSGVPYLVVSGVISKKTEAVYGCPELPYFYFKYESGFAGKWSLVPVEKAPEVLRTSNLLQDRKNDSGTFQRIIPRTYDEWDYVYKNEHRNERKVWDCRPPLQPLPDVPLSKPVDVKLETVESIDYVVKSADESYKYLSDRKGGATRANCSRFFRPPSRENLMWGERFANDPTGNIRLPYSGPTPLLSGRMLEKRTERYCDEKFVWFVAGHEERGKTSITKYTTSGNFLYNIRFDDPKTADNNLARSMVFDSAAAEQGYFYFYWNQSLPMSSESSGVYPNRMTRFRFQEPTQEAASK